MMQNIFTPAHTNAINSYTSFNSPSKVIGTLIEKINNNIKLDLGDNRVLNIELKEDMELEIGEKVAVERSNIKSSSLSQVQTTPALEKSQLDFYSLILSEFNAELSSENISALEKMDRHGIELNRENFEAYSIARDSLGQIKTALSYESAVKLTEQNFDLESEPVDSIARKLKEISEDIESSKSIAIPKNSELSTEQAEVIAKDIYGSRMGKDITDIIKVLHREGVSVTKKNIEQINDLFYKLNDLKDIGDTTFIKTMESKLDASIENLYRVKNYSKSEVTSELSALEEEKFRKLASLVYEKSEEDSASLKSKSRVSDEDISDFLKSIGVEVSNESIELAKKFIKSGVDLTSQNIESLMGMKRSLATVVETMDYEKASALQLQDIDISQTDIAELAAELKFLGESESITEDELVLILKRRQELKVSDMPKVIPGSASNSETENIGRMVNLFKDLATLNPNTIAIQIKRDLPMTLSSLQHTHSQTTPDASGLSDPSTALLSKLDEVHKSFGYLKAELTTTMVSKAISENISLENMDITLAARYVEQYRDNMLKFEADKKLKALSLVESLSELSAEGDIPLLFAIKNKKPLSLGEIESAHSLLKNREQLGHKLSEISNVSNSDSEDSPLALIQRLKESVSSIYKGFMRSKEDIESAHNELELQLRDIESHSKLFGLNEESAKSKLSEAFEKLEENKQLSQENRVLQLPLYMNGQFSNLNMYFRDRKSIGLERDPDDISAVLSIDTVNMGNLNIGLDVEKKNISLKIGLEDLSHQDRLKESIRELLNIFESLGYSLSSLEFYSDSGMDIFDTDDSDFQNTRKSPAVPIGSFDLKV